MIYNNDRDPNDVMWEKQNTFNDIVFWREDFTDDKAKGGFYIRAVDLRKFLESVEEAEHGGEVVGLRFEDNNLEVIVKPKNG